MFMIYMFMTIFEFGCVKCEFISDFHCTPQGHIQNARPCSELRFLKTSFPHSVLSTTSPPPLTFMCMLMQFLHILCNRPNGRHLWQAGDCKAHSFASTLYAADFSTR